ncbi:MAG: methyltransferase domain-containing protein [Hyphomicrobiaceae bacterium]
MLSPSFMEVATALEANAWTFAKTMPNNPHEYSLRKRWIGDLSFDAVVTFIREKGYTLRFGRTDYICLDVNGRRYWTMGAPLHATTLINRAENGARPHPYDLIAPRYDALHSNAAAVAEDQALMAHIGYVGGSVLDVGCGTGLFLDYVEPDAYVGVDPSHEMLSAMAIKHPRSETLQVPFEAFWTPYRFDLIVSLYGAPNYIQPWAFDRFIELLARGGRYFLVFYGENYVPVTHLKTGILVPFHRHPRDILPGKIIDLGNYFAIDGSG